MPPSKARKDTPFNGYLQIDLSEVDIPLIEAAIEDFVATWMHLEHMVRDGYRIAIIPDIEGKTVKVTAQDIREDRSSYGWMLSGEGQNPQAAICVLTYKHVARMNSLWTPFLTQAREAKRFR